MSLTVRHLNGDSTFLLLLSPNPYPTPTDFTSAKGVYSILIDPWITGSSVINGKWFSVTDRVEPSAVSHLSELEEPDLVICSQNKPDHTHKETLIQLRPEGKTLIAAEPGAARLIKSWNHFDPNRVHPLTKYDPRAKFGNSLRLYIPPLSLTGHPGELCISFIPAKNYVTGLHNAIGITYQAPTSTKSLAGVTTVDLPRAKYTHFALSPASLPDLSMHTIFPTSPRPEEAIPDLQQTVASNKDSDLYLAISRPNLPRSKDIASSELLAFRYQPTIRPYSDEDNTTDQSSGSQLSPEPKISIHQETPEDPLRRGRLPTPPDSPDNTEGTSIVPPTSSASTPMSSLSSLSIASATRTHRRTLSASEAQPSVYPGKPKAVSVLYSPHGIALSDLRPYVQNHLVKIPGALPLNLLLHSFDLTFNPWFLGGNITTGAAGGMTIARALMARCWISAHDEQKEKAGVAIKLLKFEQMSAESIRRALAIDQHGRGHGWTCDVRSLPCGKEITLSGSERDLLVGSTFDAVQQGSGPDNPTLSQKLESSAGG